MDAAALEDTDALDRRPDPVFPVRMAAGEPERSPHRRAGRARGHDPWLGARSHTPLAVSVARARLVALAGSLISLGGFPSGSALGSLERPDRPVLLYHALMELTPGMVIAGRYRVEHRVGAGGMGEVWAAEHDAVGARVALKTLLPAAACDHEIVARFKREAYFLGRIRSDHVARVIDFVADDAVGPVLVMEFVDGTPLAQILQARSLSVEETVDLGVDVLHALCDLHRSKVIHRDLKPGNIIMKPLPDGSTRAIIVDFGVSRAVSGGGDEDEITGITRVDMAVGTMEYMAPEQILNSRDVTAASDLYALGAMLFRAVAGRHLFGEIYDADLAKRKLTTDPPPLRTGRDDQVAQGLEHVVNTALQRRPRQRFSTAELMLTELTALRDVARALALDLDQATTQNGFNELPGIRPRVPGSEPFVPPEPPPPKQETPTVRESLRPAASMPSPSRPVFPSFESFVPPPASLPAAAPTSLSAVGASISTPPAPRGRSVSLPVALGLVLVALAGGAGLGSSWTQRKLSAVVESVTAVKTPAASVEAVVPEPTPTTEPSAAPPSESDAAAPPASAESDAAAPPASAASSAAAPRVPVVALASARPRPVAAATAPAIRSAEPDGAAAPVSVVPTPRPVAVAPPPPTSKPAEPASMPTHVMPSTQAPSTTTTTPTPTPSVTSITKTDARPVDPNN